MEMTPPKNVKDVQSLKGRVATLNMFVSKVTNKCLLFYKTLKKAFKWTDECRKVFEKLKAYLASLPLLSLSKPGEELSLYLAVSPMVVNSALIREEDHIQLPIYYTSQVLRGVKGRYPFMEKLAFALVTIARKFRPYFQAHTITKGNEQSRDC